MTYSYDFRKKVLETKAKEGLSFGDVAARFCVGIASVVRWSKKLESQKKRHKPATKVNMEALKKDIAAYPDAYQYERSERLGVTQSAIWYALQRLGVTYKKNPSASQGKSSKTLCLLSNSKRF